MGCCQSNDSRTCSEKHQHIKNTIKNQRSSRPSGLSDKVQHSKYTTPQMIADGYSPRRLYNSTNHTKIRDINNRHHYCLLTKQPRKPMVAALALMSALVVVSVRAVLQTFYMLSHLLNQLFPVLCTCSCYHSLPVGSPSPPSRKQMLLASCGSDLKTKIIVQVEYNQSLPRSSNPNPPVLRRGIQSAAGAQLDCVAVRLVVPPASAHGQPNCALQRCRCCLKTTRES